jgi:hypothetical protein
MQSIVKINGIYDERTIRCLIENQVYDYAFDLRPKSLNFIQTYKIAELLKRTQLANIYLRFDNEKDFVINKILDDLSSHLVCKKLYLEFHDHQESSYYEQFNKPYFLHIDHPSKVTHSYLGGDNLAGACLDYDFLLDLYRYGDLSAFVADYYKILSNREESVITVLERKWGADIYPSICDFFDFKIMSLPIDSCVEINFRNVDLDRVQRELKLLPSL